MPSLIIGIRTRLTTKPAASFTSTGTLPISFAIAKIFSIVSGVVWRPAITSTSFMTGAGLKKCIPTTGRSSPLDISVSEREEVLDAKIVSGLQIPCNFENSSFFRSIRSSAASTTRSQSATLSFSPVVIRPRMSSILACSILPFETSRERFFSILCLPPAANSSEMSQRTTSYPSVTANACAIPEPIVPAPITPTFIFGYLLIFQISPLTVQECAWFAFFEECKHGIMLVLALETGAELVGLDLQRPLIPYILSAVDRHFGCTNRDRGICGDPLRQLDRLFHQAFLRIDMVDQPDLKRSVCVDPPCGVEHLFGPAKPDDTGEPLGAAEPGGDAKGNLRLRKNSIVRRDANITGGCKLTAAAQCVSVDCGDDRDRQGGKRPENTVAFSAPLFAFLVGHFTHHSDVSPRNKGFFSPSGDNQAAGFVNQDVVDRFSHLIQHLCIERIHRLWTVDRHDPYKAFLLILYKFHTNPPKKYFSHIRGSKPPHIQQCPGTGSGRNGM